LQSIGGEGPLLSPWRVGFDPALFGDPLESTIPPSWISPLMKKVGVALTLNFWEGAVSRTCWNPCSTWSLLLMPGLEALLG